MTRYKVEWETILLAIVVIVGLAARLHDLDYNFDGDEVFSVKLASKPFSELISGALDDRPHPPLHHVLLHLWIKAFGASETAARALSISFSGAFLLLSYRLFRRFVPPLFALGVLSIMALSPLFVYYGQQARPYALITFLATVNLLSFVRVLEEPHGDKPLAIWAVSSVLLLYAQYLAALIIAFQTGVGLFYLQSERLKVLLYGSVACVSILPWIMEAMGSAIINGNDPLNYIHWIKAPTALDFLWFYVSVFGEPPGVQTRWLLAVLAVLGVVYLYRLVASGKPPAGGVLLLLLIAIGLPAVVYLISVWGPKPVFTPRQLLGSAIAFVAVVGLGMATLPRALAAGSLLILVAWTAAAFPQASLKNIQPPWQDMAKQIDAQFGSMSVIAQEKWVIVPLGYYRKAGSVRHWNDLADHEKKDRLLFVCRPFSCSNIEIGERQTRSLVATWRWQSGNEPTNQLRLYEITGSR